MPGEPVEQITRQGGTTAAEEGPVPVLWFLSGLTCTHENAMTKAGVGEYFMTSPSPGQIARYLKNSYYKTVDEYLFTLADVMTREYRAIVDAGFILQLD